MRSLLGIVGQVVATVLIVGALALSATATAATSARDREVSPSAPDEGLACVVSDDATGTVVCGGELLQRYVDASMLLMSSDTCTRLLEELFGGQVCIVGQSDCGKIRGAAPLPPRSHRGSTMASASAGSAQVPAIDPAAVCALTRATDERVPGSWSSRPPSPPPRA